MAAAPSPLLGEAPGTTLSNEESAILIKQEILLILVGGLFGLEAISVIVQVGSFKSRGKRVFRMSPIHHHYQQKGMHEAKIVTRFWMVVIILAVLTIITFKVRWWMWNRSHAEHGLLHPPRHRENQR